MERRLSQFNLSSLPSQSISGIVLGAGTTQIMDLQPGLWDGAALGYTLRKPGISQVEAHR